ncbi:uracil-DNA glycosylase family protein [Chloroflexota bacterium]
MSVKPSKGVRVAIPNRVSFKSALEFVNLKKPWIQKHVVRIKQIESQRQAMGSSIVVDKADARKKLTSKHVNIFVIQQVGRNDMTGTQSRIRKLFENWKCENFFDYGQSFTFKCADADENKCACNSKVEQIWTPSFGDEAATVMLVAEAPSTGGGIGPHLGGFWRDLHTFERQNQEFIRFRDYFSKELGFIPYFTDLVKCGTQNTKNKALIRKRADYCGSRYLLQEIEIINPTSIFCIGRTSYDWLTKHKLANKSTGKPINIHLLIHYSKQAGLPLTHEDKKLIWKWQLSQPSDDSDMSVPLSKLSYFNPARKLLK